MDSARSLNTGTITRKFTFDAGRFISAGKDISRIRPDRYFDQKESGPIARDLDNTW
jgi:hypothetical protein